MAIILAAARPFAGGRPSVIPSIIPVTVGIDRLPLCFTLRNAPCRMTTGSTHRHQSLNNIRIENAPLQNLHAAKRGSDGQFDPVNTKPGKQNDAAP